MTWGRIAKELWIASFSRSILSVALLSLKVVSSCVILSYAWNSSRNDLRFACAHDWFYSLYNSLERKFMDHFYDAKLNGITFLRIFGIALCEIVSSSASTIYGGWIFKLQSAQLDCEIFKISGFRIILNDVLFINFQVERSHVNWNFKETKKNIWNFSWSEKNFISRCCDSENCDMK